MVPPVGAAVGRLRTCPRRLWQKRPRAREPPLPAPGNKKDRVDYPPCLTAGAPATAPCHPGARPAAFRWPESFGAHAPCPFGVRRDGGLSRGFLPGCLASAQRTDCSTAHRLTTTRRRAGGAGPTPERGDRSRDGTPIAAYRKIVPRRPARYFTAKATRPSPLGRPAATRVQAAPVSRSNAICAPSSGFAVASVSVAVRRAAAPQAGVTARLGDQQRLPVADGDAERRRDKRLHSVAHLVERRRRLAGRELSARAREQVIGVGRHGTIGLRVPVCHPRGRAVQRRPRLAAVRRREVKRGRPQWPCARSGSDPGP